MTIAESISVALLAYWPLISLVTLEQNNNSETLFDAIDLTLVCHMLTLCAATALESN